MTKNIATVTNEALQQHADKASAKIREMQLHGATFRKLIEVVVKDGAVYSSGTPPSQLPGYYGRANEPLSNTPGDKVVGYVIQLQQQSITLSQGLLKRNTQGPILLTIGGCAVYSFRTISLE